MRDAAASGAVVSVNHPKPFGPAWDYGDIAGFHAVEIWNGPWPRLNTVALAFWEERLRRGERIAAVGGSDTHQLKTPDPDARHSPRIGAPTTWVEAGPRPTVAAILAAIREGRAFVSASPRGPQLYLDPDGAGRACVEARGATGCALLLISEAGVVDASTIDADAASRSIAIPAGTRYVRAQLVDRTGDVRALLHGHRTASGLPAEVPTIASALRPFGYRTALYGKWHLGVREGSRPHDRGFDEWFGFLAGCVDYYSHIFYFDMDSGRDPTHDLWEDGREVWRNGEYFTNLVTERAVSFIRRTGPTGRPFFLYVPYSAPHWPMHAPREYVDRFPDLAEDRRITA